MNIFVLIQTFKNWIQILFILIIEFFATSLKFSPEENTSIIPS